VLDYFHVCDYAFVDQGGKQCIIGIFDGINAATFPATHPMLALALRLRGTPHAVLKIKIELGRPNGEVLAGMQGDVTISADGTTNMQVNMASVVSPEAGRYTFKVSADGEALTSHSMQVRKIQAPLQSAPPGVPPKQFH